MKKQAVFEEHFDSLVNCYAFYTEQKTARERLGLSGVGEGVYFRRLESLELDFSLKPSLQNICKFVEKMNDILDCTVNNNKVDPDNWSSQNRGYVILNGRVLEKIKKSYQKMNEYIKNITVGGINKNPLSEFVTYLDWICKNKKLSWTELERKCSSVENSFDDYYKVLIGANHNIEEAAEKAAKDKKMKEYEEAEAARAKESLQEQVQKFIEMALQCGKNCSSKAVKELCNEAAKLYNGDPYKFSPKSLLKSLSLLVSDDMYREAVKTSFADLKSAIENFKLDESNIILLNTYFPKFVRELDDCIMDAVEQDDAKAKEFQNNVSNAYNKYHKAKSSKDALPILCDDIINMIKNRKRGSLLKRVVSKSDSYLKEIMKSATSLKKIGKEKVKKQDVLKLCTSINKAVKEGEKMKQKRVGHYPLLSYDSVRGALTKLSGALRNDTEFPLS